MRLPHVARQPVAQMLSLTAIGTPASGIASPFAMRASTARACAQRLVGIDGEERAEPGADLRDAVEVRARDVLRAQLAFRDVASRSRRPMSEVVRGHGSAMTRGTWKKSPWRAGALRKRVVLREARAPRRRGTRCAHRRRGRSGGTEAEVELLDLLDVAHDRGELLAEAVELLVRDRDSGELRDVRDFRPVDQCKASWTAKPR